MRIYVQQIDEKPLDGKVFDREALEELSKEGVTLVSDLDLFIIFFNKFLCWYCAYKRKFIRFNFGVHEDQNTKNMDSTC